MTTGSDQGPSRMTLVKANLPRRVKSLLAAEAMEKGKPMGDVAGELIREALEARGRTAP